MRFNGNICIKSGFALFVLILCIFVAMMTLTIAMQSKSTLDIPFNSQWISLEPNMTFTIEKDGSICDGKIHLNGDYLDLSIGILYTRFDIYIRQSNGQETLLLRGKGKIDGKGDLIIRVTKVNKNYQNYIARNIVFNQVYD